jgi:hypothetical protein
VAALAHAGVFRLRSVLVGTVAYQSYPAILGTKLSNALLQTSDVDIAQFTSISVAVGDQTLPMLEVLRSVDKTFREVPHTAGHRHTLLSRNSDGSRSGPEVRLQHGCPNPKRAKNPSEAATFASITRTGAIGRGSAPRAVHVMTRTG